MDNGAKTSSGNGITLISSLEASNKILKGDDLLQAYISNPVLTQGSKPGVMIKTDLRIYGVVTSFNPPRFYISVNGYYRTGAPDRNFDPSSFADHFDKLVHVTNNGPKLAEGIFVMNLDADEEKFASIGSLERYWTILKEQGQNPDEVWVSIRSAINKMLLSPLASETNEGGSLRCGAKDGTGHGAGHTCGKHFSTFFADVGVTTNSEAYIYESHFGCPLKSPGIGDVEAADKDVAASRSTRKASWGSIILGNIAQFENGYYSSVKEWIRQETGNTLLSEQVIDELATAATESRYACELGFESSHFHALKELDSLNLQLFSEDDRHFYKMYTELQLDEQATLQRGGGSSCRVWKLFHEPSTNTTYEEICSHVPGFNNAKNGCLGLRNDSLAFP